MRYITVIAGMVMILSGCTPGPQAQGQLPLSKGNSKTWTLVPMNNGPSFHVACYEGNKMVLLDSYMIRENEFHLTSPKTLTIIKGGCDNGGS